MNTSYETIEIRKEGKIGWLLLNRPQVKNALSALTFQEIHRGIDDLVAEPDIVVIVLSGNGGVFSSGRDFNDRDIPPDFEDQRSRAFAAVEYCPKPTIAAVAGYAITGGLTLAISCDMIIAAQDSIFQDTHAKLGVITLRASRLYEVLGPMKTKELLFTSRRISSHEALAMGLINQVVPAAELEQAARALAEEISRNKPEALLAIKQVVNQIIRRDQAQLIELEELAKRRYSDLYSEQHSLDASLKPDAARSTP
ncbi:enoyl-CoA hydratase/isomerase family protein [Pollutimonas bauzanensis]|uniref:3-hydroxypropionyl-coenzyme A dehydratase n=1 Tax=Pollutimonas bauzanensis TaxID=658167 RepID=A0A1M5UN27_9BURK|nr:enoyl-CoA hydratase/isomerase family protein [Pollutimonas bauzanensis]SHH64357.1 3-hydroxypropionyl-coenzyme A dehydratase [Pollutimonas bauzanensis]